MRTAADPTPEPEPLLAAFASVFQDVHPPRPLSEALVKTVLTNNRIVAEAARELMSLDCLPGTSTQPDTSASR